MSSKTDKTPLDSNVMALMEIAKKLGKRTTPLNLFDPQVSRHSLDWKGVLSEKSIPSDHFIRKTSYKVNDLEVTLRVNDEYLAADIKGMFDNSVLCSFVVKKANNPAMKLLPKGVCKGYEFNVFADSNHNLEKTISFLQSIPCKQFATKLQLSPKESLHIGHGWATLYLQRFTCDEVFGNLETIYQLLDLIPREETQINIEGLPEQFKMLIPLLKRWAISDDNERSEKLSRASSKTLNHIVLTVSPNFKAINQYLDSFENLPLPDHAILLGALGECAAEAQLVLKTRKK